ncbi:hypothetical protein GGR54DRAFT_586801 [Hypoxylon sp. NC1633]|nr:hypothetical protein GGR54DRAFT_586801 [Hypoxylon sp. NC1633]
MVTQSFRQAIESNMQRFVIGTVRRILELPEEDADRKLLISGGLGNIISVISSPDQFEMYRFLINAAVANDAQIFAGPAALSGINPLISALHFFQVDSTNEASLAALRAMEKECSPTFMSYILTLPTLPYVVGRSDASHAFFKQHIQLMKRYAGEDKLVLGTRQQFQQGGHTLTEYAIQGLHHARQNAAYAIENGFSTWQEMTRAIHRLNVYSLDQLVNVWRKQGQTFDQVYPTDPRDVDIARYNMSLLEYAVKKRFLSGIIILLNAGADVHTVGSWDWGALASDLEYSADEWEHMDLGEREEVILAYFDDGLVDRKDSTILPRTLDDQTIYETVHHWLLVLLRVATENSSRDV